MTVLAKYQRLEAEAIWRPDPQAQRRDVVVSIGKATLTISAFNGTALTHWSLPAIQRLNPSETPALYGPGDDAPETLEIADPEMIDAIEKVLKAIRQGAQGPGRARGLLLAALALAVLAAGIVWAPGAIIRHTASLVPEMARTGIGGALMTEVERLTGAPCAAPAGLRALADLEARLFPGEPTPLRVLPSALTETAHLPGGTMLISRTLVEDYETPDALAGFLVAEDLRRDDEDPLARLLSASGLRATLALLSTGRLQDETLGRMAEWLVGTPPAPVSDGKVRKRLADLGIPDGAYARARAAMSGAARAPSGETGTAEPPVLEDGDWIALQRICED